MIFDNKKSDSVIIFMHIPKTGGCTLNSIINKQYDDNHIFKQMFPGSEKISFYKYLNVGIKENLKVVMGHVYYGVHTFLTQKNYSYITLIRNPIHLTISLYYYVLSDVNNYYYPFISTMSLYEFITSDLYGPNLQTRMLNGHNIDDLDSAVHNLKNNFSFVGITERFDESLKVLNKLFNWNVDDYTLENITPNKPLITDIDPNIIDLIASKNKNDFEIYKIANEILDNELV